MKKKFKLFKFGSWLSQFAPPLLYAGITFPKIAMTDAAKLSVTTGWVALALVLIPMMISKAGLLKNKVFVLGFIFIIFALITPVITHLTTILGYTLLGTVGSEWIMEPLYNKHKTIYEDTHDRN